MSTRLTVALFLAASLWGQQATLMPGISQMNVMPAAPSPDVPRAEDSPDSRYTNLLFYNNPRGIEPEAPPPPASTVSVEQLQHPLTHKGAGLLNQAQNFAAMGRHDKAIAKLQEALKERSAIPYAHGMLGVEYLKTNQFAAAIAELEQTLASLPHNVAARSNLAYALALSGNYERGEQEARQALDLDHNNPKTRHVLNQILQARQSLTQNHP